MEPTSAHLPAGSAASQPLPPPAALGGGQCFRPFPSSLLPFLAACQSPSYGK